MIADTVEYAEWHHGVRTEGAIYGFFNFITKIAMAIGDWRRLRRLDA